jgi:hypothetical protein
MAGILAPPHGGRDMMRPGVVIRAIDEEPNTHSVASERAAGSS